MQVPWGAALGIGFIAVITLLHGDEYIRSKEELNKIYSNTEMNIVPLNTPSLSGPLLQLFAYATRTPLVGPILLKLMKRDNRVIQLRELAAYVPDTPLYYPLHIPTTDERNYHEKYENEISGDFYPIGDKFNFKRWTIQDYTNKYKTGEITPLQVARAVLESIRHSNSGDIPLRAVITVNEEEVLREAEASTKRYASGQTIGVLDGVPVLIKDELDLLGYETNSGTSFMGKVNGVSKRDSIPVARIRAAGALIAGKTNMHEIGGGTTGINIFYGPARNAYSKDHLAGGSSGGSAAAVAAGIVPLALGADGGGSVRIPSSFNGVVGIKATFMRIPEIVDTDPSLAHIGPITGSVQDAALAYSIMSGAEASIPMSTVQPPPHVNLQDMESMDLSKLRVGVFPEFVAAADPTILAQYEQQLAYLVSLGATLVNISIPNLMAIHYSHGVTIMSEMAFMCDKYHDHIGSFSPEIQIQLQLARISMSGMDFLAAQVIRNYATRLIKEIFASVDVFITPSTSVTATPLLPEYISHGLTDLALLQTTMRFIILGNLVGFPSMAVPMGYKDQLPTSILVQAAHWNEHTMLYVARVIEKNCPINQPTAYYYDILQDASRF